MQPPPHPDSDSPIMSVTPTQPGRIIVKMGMFPRMPQPAFENFVAHKHAWEGTFPGITQYRLRIYGEKV